MMDDRFPSGFFVYYYLRMLSGAVPLLLVWIAAVVLAVRAWRRHPQVSLLTLLSMGLFIGDAVVGTFAYGWMIVNEQREMLSVGQVGTRLDILNWGRILLRTVAWILLLIALFRWRGSSTAALAIEQPYSTTEVPHETSASTAIREGRPSR
jgi:hypothetical protein